MSGAASATIIGRYAIYGEIASGGMASVHFGRLLGPVGFSRTVAIKRLHPHLARDPEFVMMFLDEARVAARIRHPNVVPTLDIIATEGQLLLVMEYVQGESLARLVRLARRRNEHLPVPIAAAIIAGALHGLHAAHEAKDERGESLGIVHRDMSPQNVLVGLDGVPRVLDFGVAKAVGRLMTTREGQIKGKLSYMAPEQIRAGHVTRSTDIYAAAVVFWEALTGERLFTGDNDGQLLEQVLHAEVPKPSQLVPGLTHELDEFVLRGLARDPSKRFATAREMARELEKGTPIANASDIGEWVERVAGDALHARARAVAEIESTSDVHARPETKQILEGFAASASAAGRESTPSGEVTDSSVDSTLQAPLGVLPKGKGAGHELSSISVSTGELKAQLVPSRRRGFAVAILGVAFGVLLFVVFARWRHAPEPAAVSAPPPPPRTEIPPVPAEEAHSAMSSPAAAPAIPSSTSRATAAVAGASRPAAAAGPTPPRGPVVKPGCKPPYTVDADGTKRYKVECL